MITRRNFLSTVSSAAGVVSVGAAAPQIWERAAAAAVLDASRPILVVLELDGGNDGLNTVVPFADDVYHSSRPTLRQKSDSVIKLSDALGLHSAMKDLAPVWEAGRLAVVQNVGYPDTNRSHSRSREIWHTGDTERVGSTGWLGRVADADAALGTCFIGGEAIPIALRQRNEAGMSIGRLDEFRAFDGGSVPKALATSASETLAGIEQRMTAARGLARRLSDAAAESGDAPELGGLRARLAIVRTLIAREPSFRLYFTSQTGFDTHASQRYAHQNLLSQVSRAVSEFLTNLEDDGVADRVVVLTLSEFGRRLKENGNGGTDHGAAAPLLLAGKPVRGGVIGTAPDLVDLDERGDVEFQIDFREVYASVLRQWLAIDEPAVLGGYQGELPLFVAT